MLLVSLAHLTEAARRVLRRAEEARMEGKPRVKVEEAIRRIISLLSRRRKVSFRRLFSPRPTRDEVVAVFCALLQLLLERKVWAYQERPFGPIYLSLRREVREVAPQQP